MFGRLAAQLSSTGIYRSGARVIASFLVLGWLQSTVVWAQIPAAQIDGLRDEAYTADYAKFRFFDYGPDPNMASGELYTYSNATHLFVYYAQNPRNINDNTYGSNKHHTWNNHTFSHLHKSDHVEFIFYDREQKVKLSFFSDYLEGRSATHPSGYECMGFWGGDGQLLTYLPTGKTPEWLRENIDFASSLEHALDYYWDPVSRTSRIPNCNGQTIDLFQNSPPLTPIPGKPGQYYYRAICPEAAAEFDFTYAIEMAIPLETFPGEPVIEVVARAHNSPSKVLEDTPQIPAEASIGDFVWYDWDWDGEQDYFEPGIPGVRVLLYWDRDGDGQFLEEYDELIASRITDGNGYYVFDRLPGGKWQTKWGWLYSGDYKVVVDESTLPAGFTRTAPRDAAASGNYYILSDTIPGADRPTLAYDEHCRTADFGYAGQGVIGDFVWSDADGDGIQDPGEPGIAGVTLNLLNQAGQIIGTTTTNAMGRYFFTNLDAGTYRVDVADNNPALEGYSLTVGPQSRTDPTAPVTLIVNPDTSRVTINLDQDFGYFSPVYGTVGDTVFLDKNWDEDFDEGVDQGVADVTVGLWRDTNRNGYKDSEDQYMGDTVTDASGKYLFTGLPVSEAGETYFAQVTDSAGLLRNYEKFYPGAYRTSTPLTPTNVEDLDLDFPYVAVGAIGDYVWVDTDHDGIQDPGEPGIAGVTLQLTGGGVTRTATTDANGRYFFGGLRTENIAYTVRVIGGVPAGLSPTLQDQGQNDAIDSDNPAGVTVTLSDSQLSNMDVDFGYYVTGTGEQYFGSIGDYIWEDADGEGDQDEPSAGFPNVTLELRNDQGRVIARTATDANGYYLFDGLPIDPAGSAYEVVITDTANVLAGYQMTTDPNLLHVILYRNSPETRHRRDADAGYRYQATNVSLKRFDAFAVGATVVLEWETAMEFETAGFQVLRATGPDAAPTPINTVLVPAMYESINGGIYRLADHGASAEGVHTYWLKELERAGAVRIYGPFRRSPQAAPPGLGIPDPYSREARPGNRLRRPTGERLSAGHAWEPHGSALAASKPVESGAIPAAAARAPKQGSDRRDNGHRKGAASLINQEAFKIPVTQTGMHFVSAEQIAEEMNISLGIVRRLLVQGQIAVTNMGQTAATWIPSDLSGIYFFGEASDSLYSRENIYWVRRAAGLAMQKLPASPHQSKVVTTFRESITLEQDVEMSPAATTDPNGEYWFWCYMHGGIPGENEEVIVFDAPGATGAAAAPATLQVFVHASTNLVPGNDHSIAASLNGVQVGVSEWDGIGPHSFVCTFDQAILRETGNELRLRAEALNESPVSVVWLDRIDLGYQRLLRAVDDSLIFNADKGRIQVEGFSGESIAVFEITDPSRPKRVVPVSTQPSGQTFSVVFNNASEQARFLALTLEAAWQPTPRADFPSSLKKVQGAEYVIITTRELSEPARALAEHRQHQGWTTMVADVKDVMDEFNHGNVNPGAIRDFLEYALSKWEKPLRFVVLAGKGSLDYRDLKGQGSNLIPPLVVGTPYGITASDTALADVDGDFVPDVAIGRLPAENTEGLEILVRKIISYEEASSGAWQNRVLLAADKPDPRVGDFRAYSDTLARLLPNGFIALKAYPSELESPREQILAGLNAGCGLFSYVGHGSADQLASEGRLFQISDLEQLTNKSFLPVFVGLTCYVGAFVDPGWDCMAERMVKVGNGGAIAALTSSWLAPNASNMAFGAQVFRARFYGGCETIGEAFREAYQASAMTGVPGYVLSIFNVFGDPATPIR